VVSLVDFREEVKPCFVQSVSSFMVKDMEVPITVAYLMTGRVGSDIVRDIYSVEVDSVFYVRATSQELLAHEILIIATLIKDKLRGLSQRANYTDRARPPLVGEVSANFC
jgi:hypothetical protein